MKKLLCSFSFLFFYSLLLSSFLFAQTAPANSPLNEVTLNISATGSGSGQIDVNGTIYDLPYSGSFLPRTSIDVKAVPDKWSRFVLWQGTYASESPELKFTISANVDIEAIFNAIPYSLTINHAGDGTGLISVDEQEYSATYSGLFAGGSTVTLVARPDEGSVFAFWKGDLNCSSNPTSVLIDNSKSITAVFALAQYTLSIDKGGNGSGKILIDGKEYALPFSGKFDYGSSVNIEGIPDIGSKFIHWSDSLNTEKNPASIIIDSDKIIKANFALDQYTLSLGKSGTGNGKLKVNGDFQTLPYSKQFNYGTVVNIEAIPDSISSFNTWEGDLKVSTNPVQVTINSDKNISANFSSIPLYTIQINSAGNGSGAVKVDGRICPLPFSAAYYSGHQLTIEAVPGAGSSFTQWSGSLECNSNPVTVTLNENKTISASFNLLQYKLDITGSGSGNGKIKINETLLNLPYKGSIDYGTQLRLEAVPNEGNSFVAWSGDLTGTTNPLPVLMDRDLSINIEFKQTIQTKIELLSLPNGSKAIPIDVTLKWKMEFDTTVNLICKLEIAKDESFDSLNTICFNIENPLNGVNNFQLRELDYKTTYFWRILVEGNGSPAFSDKWLFTTQCKPVAAPTGLTARAAKNEVVLNWIDNSDNELYFAIFRKDGDTLSTNGFQPIDTVQAGTTSYSDTRLQPGALYTYKICALNSDTVSCFSNLSSVAAELTAISENSAPKVFKLSQNYPNPFNPVTVISYQLPVSSLVELKIYNMLGQELSTLVNETKGPGYYRSEWDASSYTSGFYIYRIIVQQNDGQQFIKTQKMLLVK